MAKLRISTCYIFVLILKGGAQTIFTSIYTHNNIYYQKLDDALKKLLVWHEDKTDFYRDGKQLLFSVIEEVNEIIDIDPHNTDAYVFRLRYINCVIDTLLRRKIDPYRVFGKDGLLQIAEIYKKTVLSYDKFIFTRNLLPLLREEADFCDVLTKLIALRADK